MWYGQPMVLGFIWLFLWLCGHQKIVELSPVRNPLTRCSQIFLLLLYLKGSKLLQINILKTRIGSYLLVWKYRGTAIINMEVWRIIKFSQRIESSLILRKPNIRNCSSFYTITTKCQHRNVRKAIWWKSKPSTLSDMALWPSELIILNIFWHVSDM